MSENQIPEAEQKIPVDDRPGHRLAEARKAKGLSLEEVASQLRLNVSMLQALENDDYSHLPPAAYVSGYVRSYARALGLSEAEVLRTNTSAPSGEPPIVGVVARSHTAQVQANDPRVRMVTLVVFGGLLLVSGGWWVFQREEPVAPPMEENTALPANDPGVSPAAAPGADGAVEAVPAPATAGTAPGVITPTVPAPAVAPAVAPARPAPVAPAPVVPAKPATATNAVAPAPAPAAAEAPKPETPPPPPLTASMPQSKVALEFSADCWVDVVDAAGRQLAYELAPAGRKIRLRGEAPFTVFFGYSPGVQVSFNDQPFDHRPFQRRDVARFKLGTAEDNTQPIEAQ